jgi:ABC-type glycerol-3-phosphate transport system substrate-binding protein
LAGCSGGDGTSDGGGSSDGDGDGGGGSSGSSSGSSGGRLEGVEFRYWDNDIYNDSRQADQLITRLVEEYNSEGGAQVQLNKQSEDAPLLEAYRSDEQPVLLTKNHNWVGQFIDSGKVMPVSSYEQHLGDLTSRIDDNIWESLTYAYSGFEEDRYGVPLLASPFAPFIANMDHFEEAGLDPEEDFPPEDYDDLIRIATELDENGPGTGFQIYGDTGDIQDVHVNVWGAAEGGTDGYFIGEDWNTVQFTNEVNTKVWRQSQEVFTEHGIGQPNTPTLSDEAAVDLVIAGEVSMCQQATFNQPIWYERGREMFEDGTLRWGEAWGGNSGINARNLMINAHINQKRPNVDQEEWDLKVEAACDFIVWLAEHEEMAAGFPNVGRYPTVPSHLENINPSNLDNMNQNYHDVVSSMVGNSQIVYPAHPDFVEIYYDIFGQYAQQGLQGELSPEEVMQRAQEDAEAALE